MKNVKIRILWFWSELLWIGLFFTIDMVTKYIFQWVRWGFITSILNIKAAWGLPMPMIILIVVSLMAICLCFIAYTNKLLSYRSFVFLMSWALGNIVDRVMYGGVRDWINIKIIPVFNIADILITIGVCIFLYSYRREPIWKH